MWGAEDRSYVARDPPSNITNKVMGSTGGSWCSCEAGQHEVSSVLSMVSRPQGAVLSHPITPTTSQANALVKRQQPNNVVTVDYFQQLRCRRLPSVTAQVCATSCMWEWEGEAMGCSGTQACLGLVEAGQEMEKKKKEEYFCTSSKK